MPVHYFLTYYNIILAILSPSRTIGNAELTEDTQQEGAESSESVESSAEPQDSLSTSTNDQFG